MPIDTSQTDNPSAKPIKQLDNSHFVKSFAKGIAILETFEGDNSSMTLTEVAKKVGITRAAARRFLLTLESLGYAMQKNKKFSLTSKVLNISKGFTPANVDIWELSKKHMQYLVDTIDEGCSAAILDGNEIEYVARIGTPHRIISVLANLGTRFPAHLASTGRSILAFSAPHIIEEYIEQADFKIYTEFSTRSAENFREILKQVKIDGYSIINQELEIGLRSLGIPLINSAGEILGGLTVVTHISRVSEIKLIEEIFPALKACAAAINHELDQY